MIKTIIYLIAHHIRIAQFDVSRESCRLIEDRSIDLQDPETAREEMEKSGTPVTGAQSCLFRFQVGLRFFVLPTQEEGELKRMTEYEAAEILPLRPEEIVSRYKVLEKRLDGYTEVAVVVAHRDEVSRHLEILQGLGIEVESLNLSSLALFRAVQKFILEKDPELSQVPVMLVYCEEEVMEIIIVSDGKLRFSRGLGIDKKQNFSQILISEVRHSLELFSEDRRESPQKILVAGNRSDLQKVNTVLESTFSLPVSAVADIDLATGLALEEDGAVNLLNEDFISARRGQSLKRKLALATGLLLLNTLLVLALFFTSGIQKQGYLRRLEESIQQGAPAARELMEKLSRVQMARDQQMSQMLILEALNDLVRIAPADCTLASLSVKEDGTLIIRGQAASLQNVLDFVRELNKSRFFRNAYLNYSNRRKQAKREKVDFEIQSGLELPKPEVSSP